MFLKGQRSISIPIPISKWKWNTKSILTSALCSSLHMCTNVLWIKNSIQRVMIDLVYTLNCPVKGFADVSYNVTLYVKCWSTIDFSSAVLGQSGSKWQRCIQISKYIYDNFTVPMPCMVMFGRYSIFTMLAHVSMFTISMLLAATKKTKYENILKYTSYILCMNEY